MNVNVPGIGVVNFPNNMSREEIKQAIQNNYPELAKHNPSALPMEESIGERALIGVGSGLTRAGQGIKQTGLRIGNMLDLVPEHDYQAYTDKVKKEREFFDRTPVGQDAVAKVTGVVGEALPYMALPGGIAGSALKKAATGAASGAIQGVTSFAENDQNRLKNTGIGAAIPVALQRASVTIKKDGGKTLLILAKGSSKKVQKSFRVIGKHDVTCSKDMIEIHIKNTYMLKSPQYE